MDAFPGLNMNRWEPSEGKTWYFLGFMLVTQTRWDLGE